MEAEDPESQTIPEDSKDKLGEQQRRQDIDQQGSIEMAFHVDFGVASPAADD